MTEWLERRPGPLYEDLIEEYSRASVSVWAVTRIVVGWITFILDPAAGLLILDGTSMKLSPFNTHFITCMCLSKLQ